MHAEARITDCWGPSAVSHQGTGYMRAFYSWNKSDVIHQCIQRELHRRGQQFRLVTPEWDVFSRLDMLGLVGGRHALTWVRSEVFPSGER